MAAVAHAPHGEAEERGEDEQEAVLYHLRAQQMRPEADCPGLPALGVDAERDEARQHGDEERPVTRPSHAEPLERCQDTHGDQDRKSTRLNSSHRCISYAV